MPSLIDAGCVSKIDHLQREAEKAWIDQQRQELARVQNGIEAILSTD